MASRRRKTPEEMDSILAACRLVFAMAKAQRIRTDAQAIRLFDRVRAELPPAEIDKWARQVAEEHARESVGQPRPSSGAIRAAETLAGIFGDVKAGRNPERRKAC